MPNAGAQEAVVVDEPPAPGAADDPPIPAGLLRLWGHDAGAKPGQKPRLTVREVAAAGVAIADSEGLEAVAMGRIAAGLGVTTMALYRYVQSKQELLELMVEVAADDPPSSLVEDGGWRAGLASWAAALRDLYRRHPWVGEVPTPGPPRGPHQLAWMERGLHVLRETRLSDEQRIEVVLLVLSYVRGITSLEQAMTRGGSAWSAEQYGRQLAQVVDPAHYPQLAAILASGGFEDDTPTTEESLLTDTGLETILDGIERLVDAAGS